RVDHRQAPEGGLAHAVAGSRPQIAVLAVLEQFDARPVGRMQNDAVRRVFREARLEEGETQNVDMLLTGDDERRRVGRRLRDEAVQMLTGARAAEKLLLLLQVETIAELAIDLGLE